jgi:hypothetical protein
MKIIYNSLQLVDLVKKIRRNNMLMRKVVLMLALGLTCSSAMAEWTKVTANDEATTYADVVTINKVGDIAKMSDVMDINKPRVGEKYLSIKSTNEYDCNLKKSRVVTFSTYSGNMGSGKVLDSSSYIHDWLPVRYGSATEALWEVACGKH